MSDSNTQPSRWALVPFERYMVEDDHPDYPMSFTLHWSLRGHMDERRIIQAIADSLDLHPILRSKLIDEHWIYDPKERGFSWQIIEQPARWFQGSWEHCLLDAVNEWNRFDLAEEAPLRVIWIRPQGVGLSDDSDAGKEDPATERSLLMFVFHHAACDGIASLEFSGDVFARYAQLCRDDEASAVQPRRSRGTDIALLDRRSELDRSTTGTVHWTTAFKFSLRETFNFFTRPAIRIHHAAGAPGVAAKVAQSAAVSAGPGGESGSPQQDYVGIVPAWPDSWLIRLSTAQTEALRKLADSYGATLNELITAVLMSEIHEYLAAGRAKRRGWIAVLVPVNMRVRRRQRLPACNAIGYAFLKRSRSDMGDWESLLAPIVNDLSAIQSWKLGGMFLDALQSQSRMPRWLRGAIRKWSRPATFVFSFVGDPMRRFPQRLPSTLEGCQAGDIEIIGLAGAPPPRPGTELAILGSVFAQGLALCFRPSQVAFPGRTFEALRARIAGKLQELSSSPSVEPKSLEPGIKPTAPAAG